MEPRVVLAEYDSSSDRFTIRMSTQMPSGFRDQLCKEVLDIPTDRVRVLVGDVGGGFGMKTGLYAEDAVVAFSAVPYTQLTLPKVLRGEAYVVVVELHT